MSDVDRMWVPGVDILNDESMIDVFQQPVAHEVFPELTKGVSLAYLDQVALVLRIGFSLANRFGVVDS